VIGVVRLDVFNLDIAVFDNDAERVEVALLEGCVDAEPQNSAAISSAHRDVTSSGEMRMSVVLKPRATYATWAHEAVHLADFVMDGMGMPTDVTNTELRAYLVGHIVACLHEIMPAPVTSTQMS